MTSRWCRNIEASRQEFVDQLIALGFDGVTDPKSSAPRTLMADVAVLRSCGLDLVDPMLIEVPVDYPFSPPIVRYVTPPDTLTWHLLPGGMFCLWRFGDHSRLEWLQATDVIERIRLWWNNREEEWPYDAGVLDLQYYFDLDPGPLFTYAVLADLEGQLGVETRGAAWYHWVPFTPKGGRDEKFKKRLTRSLFAEAIDLGMLHQPVRDWNTVAARLDSSTAQRIVKAIAGRGSGFLLMHYRRPGPDGEREGVLGVKASLVSGDIRLEAVHTAELSDRVLTHRAGLDAPDLTGKAVLVVGVGAIGSFAADGLARSGIGALTLVDPDRMLPGNSTRHLCGPEAINQSKPVAVRDHLVSHGLMSADAITPRRKLLTAELAFELIPTHDIVIDATADYGVEWALQTVAANLDVTVIHVRLHRLGGLCRVNRSSRYADPTLRLGEVPALDDEPVGIIEVGCVDPISSTPPWAVQAAAARAVAAAIDVLSGRWELPDSYIDILIPQPDPPYDRIGSVTANRSTE